MVMTTISKQAALVGFSGGSDGKESAYKVGDLGSIPGLGRSLGGGHGNPLQYSCQENPHGQRSLTGYSPWGRNESDMTERLSTAIKEGDLEEVENRSLNCVIITALDTAERIRN